MHDPEVVVFDLHVPVPIFRKGRPESLPAWGVHRRRFNESAKDLNGEPSPLAGQPIYPWWMPKAWRVFVGGRQVRWALFSTVWHTEPDGHDSGRICKGMRSSNLTWHNVKWAVRHRRHLSVQVHPYQRIHRWLFLRCAECGHRFFWKQQRFGYMGSDDTLHEKCISLRSVRGQLDDAAKALTFTATETERWRVERWLARRESTEVAR